MPAGDSADGAAELFAGFVAGCRRDATTQYVIPKDPTQSTSSQTQCGKLPLVRARPEEEL